MNEYKKSLQRELEGCAERTDAQERLQRAALVQRVRSVNSNKEHFSRIWLVAGIGAVALTASVALVLVVGVKENTLPSNVAPSLAARVDIGHSAPKPAPVVPEKLELGGRSRIWVEEKSDASMSAKGAGVISLKRGRILVSVDPSEGRSVVVDSPFGTVLVHGTIFSVEVEQHSVSVRLYTGSVEFRSKDEASHSLSPGEVIQVDEDGVAFAQTRELSVTDAFYDMELFGSIGDSPTGSAGFPNLLALVESPLPQSDPDTAARPPRRPVRRPIRRPRGVVTTVDEQATVGDRQE